MSKWDYKGQDEVRNQHCNLWELKQRCVSQNKHALMHCTFAFDMQHGWQHTARICKAAASSIMHPHIVSVIYYTISLSIVKS